MNNTYTMPNKKNVKKVAYEKKKIRCLKVDENTQGRRPTCLTTRFTLILVYMYLYVWIHSWDRNHDFDKKRKEHASPGNDANTAEASGSVGRGEQGEARPAYSTPNGGPHLALALSRLKTWCKIDFSIGHTTPPSWSYMCYSADLTILLAHYYRYYLYSYLTNSNKCRFFTFVLAICTVRSHLKNSSLRSLS